MGELIMKAAMGAMMGGTLVTLLFLAPGGRLLTGGASMDKVQPGAGPQGSRGPRYVWVGGYYGGK